MIESSVNREEWWKDRLIILSLILFLNAVGFNYYVYFLLTNGYLPTPFIYDKSNTFMDLFNVLYWSYDDGRYTEWRSVYPPLNFLALRFVGFILGEVEYGSPEYMRDTARSYIVLLGIVYLIMPIILMKMSYWRGFLIREKIVLYFLIILSTPMLFALERGNLILIAPVFLALAIGRIGIARVVGIALLINIKPYFAILLIYYVARRNWRGLVACSVASGLIFVVTGLLLDNNFLNFFNNLFNFSKDEQIFSLREVMSFPSSVSAFSYVLKDPSGLAYASTLSNSFGVEYISGLIDLTKWAVLFAAIAIVFKKQRKLRDSEIMALLILFVCNLGVWVGGYTLIFYVALVPILVQLRARLLYIVMISILALPLDVVALLGNSIGSQYSYLTDSYVDIQWTIGMGSLFRPIANLLFLLLLSGEFFWRESKVRAGYAPRYDEVVKLVV